MTRSWEPQSDGTGDRSLVRASRPARFAWTQVCCEDCWADRNPGRDPYRLTMKCAEVCVHCGARTSSGIYVRLHPGEIKRQGETLVVPVSAVTGTADRALVREIVSERARRRYNDCGFCGAPCQGEACSAHADLLEEDPNYALKGRAA